MWFHHCWRLTNDNNIYFFKEMLTYRNKLQLVDHNTVNEFKKEEETKKMNLLYESLKRLI